MNVASNHSAAPFLRWAGSKRRVLAKIIPSLPTTFGRYFEPFLGGASLFFALRPAAATLSDLNSELIDTYRAVKEDPDRIIEEMRRFRYSRSDYYRIRDKMVPKNRWEAAARFIALNKMCWNGLYRVNSRGSFNVPFGSLGCPGFLDPGQIRAASSALSRVRLRACDFQVALQDVRPGDLVYLDPPYVVSHSNNGFAEYNARIFSWLDQGRLAVECRRLARLGASFVMTNGAHESVESLYKGFAQHRFRRASTIANDPDYRRRCEEAIITGGSRARRN